MSDPDDLGAYLPRVAAECRADVGDLATVAARLASLRERMTAAPDDDAVHAAVSLWLDHYYTAAEAALRRLVVAVDGSVPAGEDWHARLLRLAALAVPSVRPAIIEAETRMRLDDLRSFRHKLRHTYLLELDPPRLAALGMMTAALHERLSFELERFARWLDALTTQARDPA